MEVALSEYIWRESENSNAGKWWLLTALKRIMQNYCGKCTLIGQSLAGRSWRA